MTKKSLKPVKKSSKKPSLKTKKKLTNNVKGEIKLFENENKNENEKKIKETVLCNILTPSGDIVILPKEFDPHFTYENLTSKENSFEYYHDTRIHLQRKYIMTTKKSVTN